MGKWYGNVGFAHTTENNPGEWDSEIIEKSYFGDIMGNRWKRQNSGGINDDVNISNIISCSNVNSIISRLQFSKII